MRKLGILVNCRELSDENFELFHNLNLLAYQSNIKVQINVTGEIYNKRVEEYELNEDFQITFQKLSGRITNAQLRGRYRELDCEYVFFIDDDFAIDNVKKSIQLLKEVVDYMDTHPTCMITRFRFNRGVPFSGKKITFTYPITSTSLSCGIIIRTKYPIFTEEQLDWHWKSDDYTMILNALEKGYGIEVDKHWFRHEIKSSPEDVVFDWKEIAHTIPNPYDRELFTDDKGNIKYTGDSLQIQASYMRSLLIEKLNQLTDSYSSPNGTETIRALVTCYSSILLDNKEYLSENIDELRFVHGRDFGAYWVLEQEEDINYDYLIVASGSFMPDHITDIAAQIEYQTEITKSNHAAIERYIQSKAENPINPFGSVIFMGSVAKDRGFPDQPLYAADKAFMFTYLKSLSVKHPNISFHYLTIPSTKSKMCDHGFDSKNIAEHIKYLLESRYKQTITVKSLEI